MYNSTNPPNIFVIYSHDGTGQKIDGQTTHVAPHTVIAGTFKSKFTVFVYKIVGNHFYFIES